MTARGRSSQRGEPPEAGPRTYREYAPSERLRPFVECFWTGESVAVAPESSAAPAVHRVLPDGCIDVVLGFSGGADEPESAMVVGTMTRALVLDAVAAECFVGVRFRTAKAAAFVALPASELTDLRVPLDELWRDAPAVREAVTGRVDAVEHVRALERVLAARVAPGLATGHRDVDEAVRRIVEAGGSLGITRLAPALGVTRQHLARRFAELVGVSPKMFARVVRLGRVVERARSVPVGEPVNWSALAVELGYYDQAHLVDEFRELAGVTPGEWRKGPL